MTEGRRARIEARNRKYPGFGDNRSAAVWARTAGVPLSSFHRYLKQGFTVEQIFEMRGASYVAENPECSHRKPRYGAQMTNTRRLIYNILILSGYVGKDGIECVRVSPRGNKLHAITFNGRPFGVYNYDAETLQLGAEGVSLKQIEWEDIRVLRNAYGSWELHPSTRRIQERLRSAGQTQA